MEDRNTGKFIPGTRFRGRVNGVEMVVARIEGTNAVIMDSRNGRYFLHGLSALEHSDVEILGNHLLGMIK